MGMSDDFRGSDQGGRHACPAWNRHFWSSRESLKKARGRAPELDRVSKAGKDLERRSRRRRLVLAREDHSRHDGTFGMADGRYEVLFSGKPSATLE